MELCVAGHVYMTKADHSGPGGILEPGRQPIQALPNLVTEQRRFCSDPRCKSSFSEQGRDSAIQRHDEAEGHVVSHNAVPAQRFNIGEGRHGVWIRVDIERHPEERDQDAEHAALCSAM